MDQAPASWVFGSSHVVQSGNRGISGAAQEGLPEIVKRSMAITSPIFLGKKRGKKEFYDNSLRLGAHHGQSRPSSR